MKLIYKNIVRLSFILLAISFFNSYSYSQDHWNAKIMLHSLNGYVDTLWIGCDADGDQGYQAGLDIIDTTFVSSGGIWGFDPMIPSSECFNLKKDIKNFVSGFQTFNIQMVDSLPDFGTQYDYISIDTNDFKFDNGQYKITSVFMECVTGYMIAIDLTSEYLYVGYDTSYSPIFLYDSIKLIFEPGSYDCLPTNDLQMEINIEIGFNYYVGTSIETIHSPKVSLYPNPATSSLFIKSERAFNKITIYNRIGKIAYSVDLISGRKEYGIDLENLVAGLYVVLLEDGKGSNQIINTKLIIQ
ncbi:MAG: T9SS type A sorting domain-containing protein [Chitinophagales bacterium]